MQAKKGHYFREFARYSSLNVLGMLGLSFYILADTFFISLGMGTVGLTALNLAIPVFGFITGSGHMLGLGAAAQFSLHRGQDQEGRSSRAFSRALCLGAGIGCIFVLLGIFASGPITRWLGADAETFQMCRCYIQVLLIFAPGFIMNNICQYFVRNDGAPHLAMAAMLTGSFSNVFLDWLFIFPLDLGIFGAILATCLAPLISLSVFFCLFFARKRNHFHLCRPQLSGRVAWSICSTGLPALVAELSSSIVMLVFNLILLKLSGNVGVAAYGVVANLSLVVASIYNGVAQGTQPLLSTYCGRGEEEVLQKLLDYALATVALISLLLYAGIFFGAEQIAAIFNSEGDALLQEIAVQGLQLYFIGGLFAGLNLILGIYFSATGQARPASLISLSRGFLLILPLCFVLSTVWKMVGLWLAFPVTELLVCIPALWFWQRQKRADLKEKALL